MNKVIASPYAPKAVGPYSQAIQADGTLYLSGQLPIDGATGTMPESIEEQTEQSLKNVGHILKEAGYDYTDVVKTTVLLADIKNFAYTAFIAAKSLISASRTVVFTTSV